MPIGHHLLRGLSPVRQQSRRETVVRYRLDTHSLSDLDWKGCDSVRSQEP